MLDLLSNTFLLLKTGGGEASAGLPRNELDNANSKAKELGMEQRVGSYTQDIKEGVFAKP